jgi:hemolysin activation/secretion protein
MTGDRAIGSTIELQANTSFGDLPLLGPEYRLPAQFYFFWDYGRPFNNAPTGGQPDLMHTLNSVGLGVRSDLTEWLFAEVEGVHRLTAFPQGAAAQKEHPYVIFTRVTMHY